jgi:hypothetical protein
MKREEFEKILLSEDGLKKLQDVAETLKAYKDSNILNPVGPASNGKSFEPVLNEKRPTPNDLLTNNSDFVIYANTLKNIGRLIPEIATDPKSEDPKKILSVCIDKCRDDPSAVNQYLLQNAINDVTTRGRLDSNAEKIVNEAIENLTTIKDTGKTETSKKKVDSIWTTVHEDEDFQGEMIFLNLLSGSTYLRCDINDLDSRGFNDEISSYRLFKNPEEVAGEIILFGEYRFRGRFYEQKLNGREAIVPNLENVNFDDEASSVLLVRHFPNEIGPLALGDLGLRDEVERFARNFLPAEYAELRGRPVITWDMWPNGPSPPFGFDANRWHPTDPNSEFVLVMIPIEVHTGILWIDYNAEIYFWIYLYIDDAGVLRGHMAYHGVWVESGVASGAIAQRIMEFLPQAYGPVNDALNRYLSLAAAGGPYSRRYYLPGRATGGGGNTYDDVSLVLVRR